MATSLSFISHPINHQGLIILSSKHYTIPPPSIPTATVFAQATIIPHVGFCERLLMVSQDPHSPSSNPVPTRQLLGQPFQRGRLITALLYQNSKSIPFLLESSEKALAKPIDLRMIWPLRTPGSLHDAPPAPSTFQSHRDVFLQINQALSPSQMFFPSEQFPHYLPCQLPFTLQVSILNITSSVKKCPTPQIQSSQF